MMYAYSLVSCKYSVDISHYRSDHFNDQGNLEDTLCPQDGKAKDHFTLPWTPEKAADRKDTKRLALENGQRQDQ